ncbi:MAG: ABC transporter permease [Anaerolineales bacterium]|nr:ABC transporter permease [Anaerolineales bacterium]MDW8162948.1 ABC transporter permease [Anaerolineales bacterium]
MSTETLSASSLSEKRRVSALGDGTLARVAKYTAVRLVTLFITVVIGVYLTILIANMGGYVDTIMRNEIKYEAAQAVLANPVSRNLPPEVREKLIRERIALEEKRLGLDQPFFIRSLRYLRNALTLNLGYAIFMNSDSGSRQVRLILLERLPATLLLTGTSELILFFSSVFLALSLSRKYGSFWDKLTIALSPTSSAPPWFYGIFFILIFAAVLKVLPFGGIVDVPPPRNPIDYGLSVLKHLILPASSVIVSSFFLSIYNWRTYFLIYSSEDYVEMARAKGLPSRDIERRYILRPTLPTIVTNFALLVISLWTGFTITETVFLWPGLGRTLYQAIGLYDTPVIVGSTIIYAYLLAITVFLLDFIYALIDPRVKIGGESPQ